MIEIHNKASSLEGRARRLGNDIKAVIAIINE